MQSLTLVIVNAAYTLRPTTNTSPYPYFWYGCLHDKHAVKMEDMEVSAEDSSTDQDIVQNAPVGVSNSRARQAFERTFVERSATAPS